MQILYVQAPDANSPSRFQKHPIQHEQDNSRHRCLQRYAGPSPNPILHILTSHPGLGLAIATYLLKTPNGPNVIAVARNETALRKLKDEFGSRVETMAADLTARDVGKRIVDFSLGQYGRLDGLVLNHGCLEPVQRVSGVDVDAWRKGFETNFFSYLDIVSLSRSLSWDIVLIVV